MVTVFSTSVGACCGLAQYYQKSGGLTRSKEYDRIENAVPQCEIPTLGCRRCISSGKALLAYLPQQRLERILAKGLPRFTEETITDPILLQEELKKVRQQGYAVAQEELEIGLSAVAAPVWNHEEEVVAAVSVSGPSFRLSSEKIPELAELTKRTANEVSHQLGYVGEE